MMIERGIINTYYTNVILYCKFATMLRKNNSNIYVDWLISNYKITVLKSTHLLLSFYRNRIRCSLRHNFCLQCNRNKMRENVSREETVNKAAYAAFMKVSG